MRQDKVRYTSDLTPYKATLCIQCGFISDIDIYSPLRMNTNMPAKLESTLCKIRPSQRKLNQFPSHC